MPALAHCIRENLGQFLHHLVQVLLVGKTLRGHPVGKEMGKLLAGIPQWRGFFEGTGIDPVTDLEHMQITGPELRNSANVVSILEFSSSGAAIREAVDVVVKRTKGKWLTGKAFPTARVKARVPSGSSHSISGRSGTRSGPASSASALTGQTSWQTSQPKIQSPMAFASQGSKAPGCSMVR